MRRVQELGDECCDGAPWTAAQLARAAEAADTTEVKWVIRGGKPGYSRRKKISAATPTMRARRRRRRPRPSPRETVAAWKKAQQWPRADVLTSEHSSSLYVDLLAGNEFEFEDGLPESLRDWISAERRHQEHAEPLDQARRLDSLEPSHVQGAGGKLTIPERCDLARNKYEGVSDKFREDKERILSGDEDAGRWSVGMGRRNRRI